MTERTCSARAAAPFSPDFAQALIYMTSRVNCVSKWHAQRNKPAKSPVTTFAIITRLPKYCKYMYRALHPCFQLDKAHPCDQEFVPHDVVPFDRLILPKRRELR